MPRIKDIAKKLGVSSATVSLVLNSKPGASEETRRKVTKELTAAGYNIRSVSKAIQNGRGILRLIFYRKYGTIVSDTPFFSELTEGIDKEARAHGCNLVISYLNERENKQEILTQLDSTPADGVILLATEMEENDLRPFFERNLNLVVLDSYFQKEKVNTVVINNIQGAYQATEFLIERGHTKIGHLKSLQCINNFREREQGFRQALADNGLPLDENDIWLLSPTLEGSNAEMKRLLEQSGPENLPTAFFADNDIIACGAIKALRSAGVRVPEDVSVIGFDDMPFCTVIEPALTTIRVFKKKMGVMAVRRLLEIYSDSDDICTKIEIGTELIERHSVTDRRLLR